MDKVNIRKVKHEESHIQTPKFSSVIFYLFKDYNEDDKKVLVKKEPKIKFDSDTLKKYNIGKLSLIEDDFSEELCVLLIVELGKILKNCSTINSEKW